MREVDVVGVRVEMPSQQPIVLLREVDGERYLPIWIGAVEATAIAFAQQGVVPPRPLTHDLLKDILEATGNPLSRGPHHRGEGRHLLRDPGARLESRSVRGRPTRSRWRCAPAAGSSAPRRCWTRPASTVPDEQEEEVERFREFLDQVTPEDFEPMRSALSLTLNLRLRVATRRHAR